MRRDLQCPYCNEWQEVCHDDGLGYEEDKRHEMDCPDCGKSFVFCTSVHFTYEPAKADCLNGDPHQLEETTTYPRRYTRLVCANCDHSEPLPADHPYMLEVRA